MLIKLANLQSSISAGIKSDLLLQFTIIDGKFISVLYLRMKNTAMENGRSEAMTLSEIQQTIHLWHPVSQMLYVPHTEKEYLETVELLDSLTDEVGEDEMHPLASLMEILGVLIEKYEDEHVPEITKI